MKQIIGLMMVAASFIGCNSAEPNQESDASESLHQPNRDSAVSESHPQQSATLNFASWPAVTNQPVNVTPQEAYMCRNLTPDESDRLMSALRQHGPHLVHTMVVRVNPAALVAFRSGRPLSVGSMVVKEKHAGPVKGETSAFAAMVKQEPGARRGPRRLGVLVRGTGPGNARWTARLVHRLPRCHAGARLSLS